MGGSSSSVLRDPTAPFSDTAARFASWAAFRVFRGHLALPGCVSVDWAAIRVCKCKSRRVRPMGLPWYGKANHSKGGTIWADAHKWAI